MKIFLVLATATTLVAAGSRSYRGEPHHRYRDTIKLDYDDIQTADQDDVEAFHEAPERQEPSKKSSRGGVYSTFHSIQVQPKSGKAQRRHSKLQSVKDSEASGTHFEGTQYGAYGAPQVQQIHTHELLTSQGLVPLYQAPAGPAPVNLADPGVHAPELTADGADISKSVYVFSAPPDPFDYVPRQTITRLPPQKHYQVVFINAPTQQPPHYHVEVPQPDVKTLVYVLVKKPERPPPINFIKSPPLPHHHHKPEVYFIRYKNRGYGLSPSPVGPLEHEPIPVGHPGLGYVGHHPQEELRGNVDYGPAIQPQFDAPPYELDEYSDDSHLAASNVLTQRSSQREVDAGVSGI